MPTGIQKFKRCCSVLTHMHDNGTLWAKNGATIDPQDLALLVQHYFVNTGISEAVCLSPYTNPELYARWSYDSAEVDRLLGHSEFVQQMEAERRADRRQGFPVLFTGVEANIVPIDPTRHNHDVGDFTLDVPTGVLATLDFVIASRHAQPSQETEKCLDCVLASLRSMMAHPRADTFGHIDRYIQLLGFPSMVLMHEMAASGTALELNENYLYSSKCGILKPGVAWGNWDLEGDAVLAYDQFGDGRVEWLAYLDYRWQHIIALARRAGVMFSIGLDWHLPTDPQVTDKGDLPAVAIERLSRFGDWLEFVRIEPAEVINSSLDGFESWIRTPKHQRAALAIGS